MRVTVSHNKGLEGAKKIVNDYADQLFVGAPGSPLQIVNQQKTWNGSTMNFSFVAQMGIFTAPLKGYVQCADKDITVELELPAILKQFIPEEKVRQQVEGKIKGFLK
jgi:hypothetical protein